MRAVASVIWVVTMLAGCAGSPPSVAPRASPTPATYSIIKIGDLVLPVASFPAGTKTLSDGAFGAADLARYESESAAGEVEVLLKKNGFLSSYWREYELANGGDPKTSLIIVVIFSDALGARTAMTELFDRRIQNGFQEMSIGGTLGDCSKGDAGDFTSSNVSPAPISVSDVLFCDLNAVVLTRIIDDMGTTKGLEAIGLAEMELAWLRK